MADYTGINVPQPGTSLQRQRRAWRIFTDQHGRRFGAEADRGNNAPIAEFQPQSHGGFSIAPWYPPMPYAKFAQEGDLDFRWDYTRLAEEWSGGTAAYYEEAGKIAINISDSITVPEVGGEVDRRIKLILGQPPLSPAIPLACELGDPWILGQMGAEVNKTLKALLAHGVANSQEVLNAIRERLQSQAATTKVPLVASSAPKIIETERVRSINDVDEAAPLSDITWPQFLGAAKKRGVLGDAEISVAWAEFKKDRDQQKKAEAA